LVLDTCWARAASAGMKKRCPGTLPVRFVRLVPLGRLRADAAVEATKVSNPFDPAIFRRRRNTVEPKGLFISSRPLAREPE